MNDRENRNRGRDGSRGDRQQEQNSGAGSRQQEQATAGGSMNEQDGRRSGQMEQQGGTYRPEGDRGLDFESDESGEFGMGQAGQQSGAGRQQEQNDSDRTRRGSQQGEWDSDENR